MPFNGIPIPQVVRTAVANRQAEINRKKAEEIRRVTIEGRERWAFLSARERDMLLFAMHTNPAIADLVARFRQNDPAVTKDRLRDVARGLAHRR